MSSMNFSRLVLMTGFVAERLQAVVLHKHRREAFLLLDFHRVEHAAVGVDADEEIVFWLEVAEDLCGIAHAQAS